MHAARASCHAYTHVVDFATRARALRDVRLRA